MAAVIVRQQRGGSCLNTGPQHASVPTWTSAAEGVRGATGDDKGPATVGQQEPGTDADVTARRGQGSGCAAGDPAARPRGPLPPGPASRRRPDTRASADMASEPPVKGQCLPFVPGGAVAVGRGTTGWTMDGRPGAGPRIPPPGRLASIRLEKKLYCYQILTISL